MEPSLVPDTILSLPFADPPVLELRGPACALSLVPVQPGEQPFLECSEALARLFKPTVTREGAAVQVRLALPDGGGRTGEAPWEGMPRFFSSLFPQAFWDVMRADGGFGPRAGMVLHLPATVRAHVHLDAGRIRARGLSGGEVDLELGAGVILLREVTGQVRLRTGAGKISGEDVSGTFDVETNAGAVRLRVSRLASGKSRVASSMGSVRVDLAPGQKIQVEARAAMGSAKNGYLSTPGAEAVLQVQTELGSVQVAEGDPSRPEPEEPHRGRGRGEWAWQWPAGAAGRRWGWGHGPFAPPEARPRTSPAAAASDEELGRILTMVKEGKISPEEAQKLLRALERP